MDINMEKALSPIGSLVKLSSLIFLAMICVLLLKSTYLLIKSIRARKWPKAKAKIIISGVDSEYSSDGDKHEPYVEYTYNVANTEYISDCCVFCSTELTFRTIAKSAVKKFRRGSVALVSYNPDIPAIQYY
jgi:hypothetical protein